MLAIMMAPAEGKSPPCRGQIDEIVNFRRRFDFSPVFGRKWDQLQNFGQKREHEAFQSASDSVMRSASRLSCEG